MNNKEIIKKLEDAGINVRKQEVGGLETDVLEIARYFFLTKPVNEVTDKDINRMIYYNQVLEKLSELWIFLTSDEDMFKEMHHHYNDDKKSITIKKGS